MLVTGGWDSSQMMSLQFLARYHDLKHLKAIELEDGYCGRTLEGELARAEKMEWLHLNHGWN